MLPIVYQSRWKDQFNIQEDIMWSVGWDIDGIVYYELLNNNQTITANLYCDQLHHLKRALKGKGTSFVNWKGVSIHHNNACPHTADWKSFGRSWLGNIASSTIFSSPCWLSLVLATKNHLDGLRLTSKEDVENELDSYFALKPKEFYRRGIYKLVGRWNDVLESKDSYFNN